MRYDAYDDDDDDDDDDGEALVHCVMTAHILCCFSFKTDFSIGLAERRLNFTGYVLVGMCFIVWDCKNKASKFPVEIVPVLV